MPKLFVNTFRKHFQKKKYQQKIGLFYFQLCIPQNYVKSIINARHIITNLDFADLGKSFVVVAQISDRKPRSRSPSKRRRPTAVEREAQEKIDRENRILLKKILEQHHGIRRSSSIPPASANNHHPK